jgi:2,3-dihydroxybenzoate decarboxylase/5-carboxyvanillate decarboxylase
MNLDRREVISAMSALTAAAVVGSNASAQQVETQGGSARLRKIATEEACSIPEVAAALKNVARTTWSNLDTKLVNRIYNARPEAPSALLPMLLDIEAGRLAVMDENGVDMHLLSLTAPGVQMFDADPEQRWRHS